MVAVRACAHHLAAAGEAAARFPSSLRWRHRATSRLRLRRQERFPLCVVRQQRPSPPHYRQLTAFIPRLPSTPRLTCHYHYMTEKGEQNFCRQEKETRRRQARRRTDGQQDGTAGLVGWDSRGLKRFCLPTASVSTLADSQCGPIQAFPHAVLLLPPCLLCCVQHCALTWRTPPCLVVISHPCFVCSAFSFAFTFY